jgi:hypothetical protein
VTAERSFTFDILRVHIQSAEQENTMRAALDLLIGTPRVWRRSVRMLSDVFVVPNRTGYYSTHRFGLLNQDEARNSVRAAVGLFELGLLGWLGRLGGRDQTAHGVDLFDRLALRASRNFCETLLALPGNERHSADLRHEYKDREAWLLRSEIRRVGFNLVRVAR